MNFNVDVLLLLMVMNISTDKKKKKRKRMHSHLALSRSPKHQAKCDEKKKERKDRRKKIQYESCAILCEYVHKKKMVYIYVLRSSYYVALAHINFVWVVVVVAVVIVYLVSFTHSMHHQFTIRICIEINIQ